MRAWESATTWEGRQGDSLEASGKRQLRVESGGDEIIAEAIHGSENETFHAERVGRLDVDELVIEEEGFFGEGGEFAESVAIDGGIGLGHVQLETPYKDIEVVDPSEFAFDVFEDGIAHIGKNGGAHVVGFEFLLPREHGGILRGPHAGVLAKELSKVGRAERQMGIAGKLLPVRDAREFAFVVGMSIGPVEGFKLIRREPGDPNHGVVGRDIGRAGQDHSIIKNNRAQSQ